jgi:ribosome-associated toxin RatA of RatAB toxin-antitoxin module
MPKVSSTTIVPARAEEAFDFIADYRNIPRLQPQFTSVRLVSEVQKGPGATVELEGRFHGMPMRVRDCIIAFAPPYRIVTVGEGALLSRMTWEMEPLDADPPCTRVTVTVEYSLRKTMGGLFMGMGSALWPFFHREIQSMTDESLRRLKGLLAGEAPEVRD